MIIILQSCAELPDDLRARWWDFPGFECQRSILIPFESLRERRRIKLEKISEEFHHDQTS